MAADQSFGDQQLIEELVSAVKHGHLEAIQAVVTEGAGRHKVDQHAQGVDNTPRQVQVPVPPLPQVVDEPHQPAAQQQVADEVGTHQPAAQD